MLSLALAFACCERQPARYAQAEYPLYTSYRDIPLVTAEEIDAIEKAKSQRDGFVYAMNYSTEAFRDAGGNIGGYSALFCGWLSTLFDIPFVPEIIEWDDLISGLASFAVDFSGELTPTEERHQTYFMTGAIAERPIKFMRITGSEPLSVLEKHRPLRYAFLEGTTTYDAVLPYLPEGFEVSFVGDHDAIYRLLKNDEIDAFFDDGPGEAAFDSYGDVTAEDSSPPIYGPVSLTTQNPQLKPFISVVQKALDSGGVYHLTGLYNQGYRDYVRHRLAMQLTPQEIEYIRLHSSPENPVRIAAEYDNYPASFYNAYDREWQGVAFDVLHEVAQYTGLYFEIANDTRTEWPDILHLLEGNRISMVMELIWTKDRAGHFLLADEPYKRDFYALISAVEYKDLDVNEVLYSRVGLIADAAYTDMFHQWFPRHTNTVEYVSNLDAFTALTRGEVDLVMATHHQLLSIVNYLEQPGYKVNIVFNHPSDSYFGFNINETVLRSVVSKAQKLVNIESIFNRWNHRVFDYRRKIAQARQPWLIGASALLLCVLFLVLVMLRRNRLEGKRLEQLVSERTWELETASEAAQAASRTKSEFLANMSHEIRTPINAVTGMTAIARSSSDLNRIYDCLDKISAASKQLLGLINDILDMSKIEAKKFDLAHEPFSLEAMVANIGSIIGVRAAERSQRFVIDLSPDIPVAVIGDEMRFSQILLNLLSNAVKFTPEGGEITLTVKRVGSRANKEEIEASVRDSGIGITEEQQARLFSAFVQAESGTAKRFGGTGLGLAISKSLAELMGGGISLESAPGKGSCFTVHVLLESGTCDLPSAFRAIKKPEEYRFEGRTLLLVEDIAINREIVLALLEDTGVTVECAENGQEAVNKFSANPDRYDLVFMDVQMPVMDGFDATRAIRSLDLPRADAVPIVAMTANAFSEDIEKCIEAGMNAHIAKPIDLEALMNITDRYLNGEKS